MVATRSQRLKCVVTGGAGFLGKHLVQQLLDSGKYDVTVFDIRDCGLAGASTVVGDLRKPDQVSAVIKGADIVFHVATAAPTGENALNCALMQGVNIDGTQHIIDACVAHGVSRLVYTSSASVVFDGRPLNNVDESTAYAQKPMDYYTKTKIQGEQMILAANGKGGVQTVALRPSGIFGEGDPVFVPTVVRQAKAGKMKFIIGSGANKMDFTYVGNVAQAHLLAADALESAPTRVAGKAYFVTNQSPVPFWQMMGDMCEGLGYRRPSIHLPFALIITVAFIFEYVVRPLLAPIKKLNSDFTVNRILIATTNRTFSSAAAAADFGYKPRLSLHEAMAATLASFKHLRADSDSVPLKKAQ